MTVSSNHNTINPDRIEDELQLVRIMLANVEGSLDLT